MSRVVITNQDDVVDMLALAAYGATAGATEAVMAANPILSGYGPVLPAGLSIVLPDLPDPQVAAVVTLWD